MTRARSWVFAGAAAIAVVLVTLAGVMAWSFRPSVLRAKAVAALSTQLGLDVTLEDLSFSFLHGFGLEGRGLVLRVPERPDLPPFIVVEKFRVDGGVQSLLRSHFRAAHLEGLQINIPPGEDRKEIAAGSDGGDDDSGGEWSKRVLIDRIDTPGAELTVLRRKPGHEPLVFQIHELTLTDVGFNRKIPFHTKLTNPLPRGLVDSTGHLGPFPAGEPSALPVDGDYTFSGADLDTIKGIAGTLTSSGHYDGVISRITVIGESQTPDFSLDLGGRPLPLQAKFEVVVDATNGATELKKVDARLLNTDIAVTGMIDNLPGPGNRSISLNARIAKGRMEDLLRLVAESEKPIFSGEVALQAALALPPGPGRKRDRWHITGNFELAAAHFSQPQIQTKLAELSRRSQGKDRDEAPADVFSNVRSRFTLEKGELSVSALKFEVPGATVHLDGRYTTESGALDFEGDLRMQASVSKAVGGWKGTLVKPFDFLFKRDGAGAVIPISVQGTRESPDLNIQFGKLLKRGFGGK